MPSSSENAMVPVEGVSPLSGTQPPLTNPYAAANSSIPNSLRTVTLKLLPLQSFLVKSYTKLLFC
jgi:DNA methyltransferase 1-associated protein 1